MFDWLADSTDPRPLQGPVLLTTDFPGALRAWEADDRQWCRTDSTGTTLLIGYAPTLDAWWPTNGTWEDSCPEAIEIAITEMAQYY